MFWCAAAAHLEDGDDDLSPLAGFCTPGMQSRDQEQAGDGDKLDGVGGDLASSGSRIYLERRMEKDPAKVLGRAAQKCHAVSGAWSPSGKTIWLT